MRIGKALIIATALVTGCGESPRPVREEDRAALEAQLHGEGCGFRSSLSSEDLQFALSLSLEQGECRTASGFFPYLDPGTLGCRVHAAYCLTRLPRVLDSIVSLDQAVAAPLPEYDWAGIRRDDVYRMVAFALGETADERSVQPLLALIESSGAVAAQALASLEKLAEKGRSAGARLREFVSAERGDERLRYLRPLVAVDAVNSRDVLEACLKDDSAAVRALALKTLGSIAPEVAARHLPELESAVELHDTVAAVLPELPVPLEAQQELLRAMLDGRQDTGSNRETIVKAIDAAAKLPAISPELCEALLPSARGSNLYLAQKSYAALGKGCRTDAAVHAQAKDDARSPVAMRRKFAAEFLGQVLAAAGVLSPNENLELLRTLAQDVAPSVRSAAEEGLGRLSLPPAAVIPRAETDAARDRALYEIARSARAVGMVRARFKGSDRTGSAMEGVVISTARGHHRIERNDLLDYGTETLLASYSGSEEWQIRISPRAGRRPERRVTRHLTQGRVSPPFTPLLAVRIEGAGTVRLDFIARFDGREWLTDYTYLGSEAVNGEYCHLFEHQSPFNRIRKWISPRTGTLCREETYLSGGGLNVVDNERPAKSIAYSDPELNVAVSLADLAVQPERGETVHESRFAQGKNSHREYEWMGYEQ